MIEVLKVKNFTIFEEVTLEFSENFNVITGETGAGKSLIVDALRFLLSQRVDWDEVLRDFSIEVVLRPDGDLLRDLEDLEISAEEGVIIRKKFEKGNRRVKSYINGIAVPSRRISEILEGRIFLGRQFSQVEILNEKFQTELFDRAMGIDISDYLWVYLEYKRVLENFRDLEEEFRDLKGREDYIKFQLKELSEANLDVDEMELLERKREIEGKLREVEWAREFNEIYDEIYQRVSHLLKISPERYREVFRDFLENLKEIRLETDFSQENILEDLEEINSRLYKIGRLKLKYGTDFGGLKKIKGELEGKLRRLEELEGKVEEMRMKLLKLEKELERRAEEINARRKEGFMEFEGKVEGLLRELGFDYVKCNVVLRDGQYWERGKGVLEILISTIPDAPPSKISNLSGGELSRVSLVLSYLGGSSYNTLIFDEIDVGVSPKVAEKMGKLLRDISQKVQVIAITHQPFTAFFANKHFLVKKVRPDLALCVEIEGKDRIRELGRMMGIEDEVKVLEVLEGLRVRREE